MENKLQELTDKLYKEGLSKGKEEGEAILAKANEKAAEIIEEAKKQAESILKKAHKDAEDYKTKVEGDVKMAAVQSIQATRKKGHREPHGRQDDRQAGVVNPFFSRFRQGSHQGCRREVQRRGGR